MNLTGTKNFFKQSFFSLVFLILATTICNAQQNNAKESDLIHLEDQFKKDYLSFGVLVQSVWDYQPKRTAGNNGFNVSKARFKISGELDQRFGYKLQTNITSTPSVVDANLYYKFASKATAKAGFYKSPFSYEYLTGAGSINFVNRSTVINQLAPKRQIGLQIDGKTSSGFLRYTAGIFNGNHLGSNQNNDDQFLYVARLEANIIKGKSADNNILLGLNASYEQKNSAATSGNVQSTFQGEQTLLGSYLNIIQGNWLLTGEFIYSWLESDTETAEYNPYGYYATAGYFITTQTQVLVRWDSFTGDNLATNSESFIAGLNFNPSSFSRVKLNYIMPTEQSLSYSQFLASIQLSF